MAAFGMVGLLQDGTGASQDRPRDCTCINGMKTYQTTPRDELLTLGPLALNRHLDKCERNLEDMQSQKDYATAESEVKIKKAAEQMDQAKKLLSNVKKAGTGDRKETREERKQLMKQISDLEKNVTELNSQYNKAFSDWWTLKHEMTVKAGRASSCKCKEVKFMLLQRLREHMQYRGDYETVQKVQQCETKVIEINKEIANAQAAGRRATVQAIEGRERIGRSVADQERLSRVLNTKPLARSLSETKTHMEELVKSRQEKLEKSLATNGDIKKQLETLEGHLQKCQCPL